MNKLLGFAAALLGTALPLAAQVPAQRSTPIFQNTAWQDRDHDRDDRDRDYDRDRDDRDRGNWNNGRGYGRYQGVLAPEWQQKFDSYYQRWQQYRATNNQDGIRGMEARMYDIMDNYRIPRNVPFGAVASRGVAGNSGYYGRGGYGRGDNDADDRGGYYGNGRNDGYYGNGRNGGYYGNGQNGGYYGRSYSNVLAPEWQQKFDSYYQRWLQYRATNNNDGIRSMEARMRDIMVHYQIPANVGFDQVASPNVVGGYYRR
jgi:hypothetical protein